MSTFLTAEWRKLIMVQYEVAPATLAPYLPSGLELDLFAGRCYVSLVAFLFDRVRVRGLAIPLHTRFEEINLRFYVVRREVDGSVKRGVVFVREFVPRRAIALIANSLYDEPYETLPTGHRIEAAPTQLSVAYSWTLGNRSHSVHVQAEPTPMDIAPGSEEEFITEHYWGYTRRRKGSTSAYQVAHPRWQTYPVRQHAVAADFSLLYGSAFAALNQQQPASVLLAEGSAVSVSTGVSLEQAT